MFNVVGLRRVFAKVNLNLNNMRAAWSVHLCQSNNLSVVNAVVRRCVFCITCQTLPPYAKREKPLLEVDSLNCQAQLKQNFGKCLRNWFGIDGRSGGNA